ncbi:hypothetical protein Pcinc_021148 [Petrolisthes cinctipes]|uniref:Uncharacterized protein n=1 Tax=Petrolisthes cinctipes TaxID=88211 RepID=A0AAE1FHK4_PETCI|nr:hypothetical protein Pcinc_021148 [Petrolisthes cinctipes]
MVLQGSLQMFDNSSFATILVMVEVEVGDSSLLPLLTQWHLELHTHVLSSSPHLNREKLTVGDSGTVIFMAVSKSP